MYKLDYQYVKTTNANWLTRIEKVCRDHTADNRAGPYMQFRTDWINEGLTYALRQTLRYVGYGYEDEMVFKDLGQVIGEMIRSLEKEKGNV